MTKNDHANYDDDDGFPGYEETTIDPGWALLVVTAAYCTFLYFVAWFWVMRKRRVDRFTTSSSTSPNNNDNNNPTKRDIKAVATLSAYVSYGNGDQRRGEAGNASSTITNESKANSSKLPPIEEGHDQIEKKEQPLLRKVLPKKKQVNEIVPPHGRKKAFMGIGKRRKGASFDDDSVLTFSDFGPTRIGRRATTDCSGGKLRSALGDGDIGNINITKKGQTGSNDGTLPHNEIVDDVVPMKPNVTFDENAPVSRSNRCLYGCSDYDPTEEMSDAKELMFPDGNIKQIHMLAGPWMFGAIIGHLSDIAVVAIISQYVGNDSMIAYIVVEFILSMFRLLAYGVYDACYKLSNLSVASEDDHKAGSIVKISVILSALASIPALIVSVAFMRDILQWLGFGQFVVDKGSSYACLSASYALVDSIVSILSSLVDVMGEASFNAVFDFYESLLGLALTFVAAAYFDCSLPHLGIIWLLTCVVTSILYVYVTIGWLSPCFQGTSMFGFLRDVSSIQLVKNILFTSFPLILVSIASDIEFRVLSVIASEIGAAEAATWILITYIWSLMEIGLDSFASASATQVNSLLAKGEIVAARRVSRKTRAYGLLYGLIISIVIWMLSDVIVRILTTDYTLQGMMMEVLPFACVGTPFIAVGSIAEAMNKEQGRYRTSLCASWSCSLLVTIPLATIMSCFFRFNTEGIVAAVVMGSTTNGMIQTVLLVYSNFNAASDSLKGGSAEGVVEVALT